MPENGKKEKIVSQANFVIRNLLFENWEKRIRRNETQIEGEKMVSLLPEFS